MLTAAVTRPDLHARVFPAYVDFIGRARVKWLINVDDVGTRHSVDETLANFSSMLSGDNLDLEFLTRKGSGCFLSAADRLVTRARTLLRECRTGIVWLEDDWQERSPSWLSKASSALRLRLATNREGGRVLTCPGGLVAKQAALEQYQEQSGNLLWFVSLVPRSRVSFNPGIWSKALFERALRQPLSCICPDAMVDPETLCADPWNQPNAYRTLGVFVDPRFQDAGRGWSAEQGLVKWEKQPAGLKRQAGVTYTTRPAARLTRVDAEELSGWLTIPHAGPATSLLVGRLSVKGGTVAAKLVGMRRPFVELRVVGHREAEIYLHRLHGWARTYPLKRVGGRVRWGGTRADTMELESSTLAVSALLTRRMPLRTLWMAPVQMVVSLLVYVVSLVAVVRRLDAE